MSDLDENEARRLVADEMAWLSRENPRTGRDQICRLFVDAVLNDRKLRVRSSY